MTRDRTYRWILRIGAVVLRAAGVRITADGLHHLPTTGPAVVAANHTGFLDFVLVGWAARERGRLVRFMAKASVHDAPVAGRLMRAMGHVRVDRWAGASAYRQGRQRLEDGEVVGVFPEATISRSFRIKRLKRGAAALALTREAPLVPCVVWGGHRLWTVDGRRTLRRGIAVRILLGEPLEPTPAETVDSLTRRLRAELERLLDEAIETYPQRPRGADDRWWLPADRGGTAPDVETGARLDREALERLGAPTD